MKIKLDYGNGKIEVDVPDGNMLEIVENKPASPLGNVREKLAESLRKPIGSVSLGQKIAGKEKICIVISDSTRAVPTGMILETLLPELHRCGISRDSITILVATGLHRPSTGEELVNMVGEKTLANYRIVNHNARDRQSCLDIGKTARGTPIILDRAYLESDFRILTGLIEPHFMAGFSGGRKAICPGISYLDMFKHFHGPAVLESPMSANAVLEGNPFHGEATEIAQKAGVDFIVNVTINKNREITGIFSGDLLEAFRAGADFCGKSSTCRIGRQADIVLTSGGGSPLDVNLYQAVKGMVGAIPAVRQDGIIIIAAQCPEEIGSREFTELLIGEKDLDRFMEKIKDPYYFVIDQWELEELIKARKKADIFFYSDCLNRCSYDIPSGTIIQVKSIEEAISTALARFGTDATISVIPEGPYVIPVFEDAS
jgi:nickel-dependent lactate racemase